MSITVQEETVVVVDQHEIDVVVAGGEGTGDMLKAIYDTNNDGTVDSAATAGDADTVDSQHAAALLARANHTGTQAASTISPQGAGSGLNADQLDGNEATAFAVASGIVSISTNITLTSSHANQILRVGGTVTITLPPGLATAFQCTVLNVGSGVVSFATGTGVTTIPATLPDLDNSGDAEATVAWIQHAGADLFDVVTASLEPVTLGFALSDETTDLAVGADALQVRAPFAFSLEGARFTVNEAPTGSGLQFDINKGGVSVLSTKATIDAGETSSATAATPPTIAASTFGDNILVSFDIDSVGSTTPGKGAKVWLYGYRTG